MPTSAALAVATAHALRPVEAHCRRALGDLLARSGDPTATQHLRAALALYREMGMTRWLDDAALADDAPPGA